VLLYAAVTIFGTATWALLFHELASRPHLPVNSEHAAGFATDRLGTLIGFIGTAVAAAIGFYWSPIAATALFFALPVFFAIGSEGFERHPSPSRVGS